MIRLERISTPNKHGRLVLAPTRREGDFDSLACDCPFLFTRGGEYCMTYVGFDGVGYRTGLAVSQDLVHWRRRGLILDRGPAGSITEFNAAMTCILRDNDLFGGGGLKKVDGEYVGTYHAYPRPGYEAGPAVIGLCFSDDLLHWRRLPWVSNSVVFKNLRYWRDQGVRWVSYESQVAYEYGNGYPRRWPLYYLAARGMWNPDADPQEMLREACDRLYGPASESMMRYFTVADDAVQQAQVHGSIWNLPPAELIFRPDVIAQMRSALADAAAVVGDDPLYKQRVATEAALWHESEEALQALPQQTRNTVDARDYNGGVWFTDKAEVTGKFMRDIVGIGVNEGVSVIGPDKQKRALTDDQTYQVTGGVRIVK